MEEIVYLNGSLLLYSEARISPFDHGFLYGNGLFETMRAYSGRVFRLDRHLQRLIQSAELLDFPLQLDATQLEAAVYATIKANGLENAYVRLTVSRGEGEAGPDPSTCKRLTIFIIARQYHPFPPQTYQRGFEAMISDIRQNSGSPLSRIKSLNFLQSILARARAGATSNNEALLLNEYGCLTEGSVSNLFLLSGNKLVTPRVECGLLPGVTRETVFELARTLEIEVKELEVNPKELLQAKEAFLTNSLMEIMPLSKVGDKRIGRGTPGPLTRKFTTAYRRLVDLETSGNVREMA